MVGGKKMNKVARWNLYHSIVITAEVIFLQLYLHNKLDNKYTAKWVNTRAVHDMRLEEMLTAA